MKLRSLLTRTLLAGAFATLTATAAQAVVIIDNYPPTNDDTVSTIAALSGNFVKAAGFTMAAGDAYSFDSVVLRLQVNSLGATPSVALYGDVAGNPSGAPLLTLANPTFALGIADYTFLPTVPFTLAPSTTYWIVATGTSPISAGIEWLASSPGVTPTGLATSAGYRFSTTGGLPTGGSTVQNTYLVNATLVVPGQGSAIPEPTTALFGLALVGICGLARRRATAQG